MNTDPSEKPNSTKSPAAASLQQAADVITSIVQTQLSLSLILVVFGTIYAPLGLRILLPPRFMATSAPSVLAAWVWYIPVLAVNGELEAFLSSVATSADLNRQSRSV
jgi:oligosaccharide translocation protein RFT1